MARKFSQEIIGTRYGMWTVTGPTFKHEKWGIYVMPVVCVCGFEAIRCKSDLVRGRTTRCENCSGTAHTQRDSGVRGSEMRIINKGARSRGIEVEITRKELQELFEAQNAKCALSGSEITFGVSYKTGKHLRRSGKTASLDRIDSFKGYTASNVQWVHKDINVAKGTLTNEEFIAMCLRVVLHSVPRDNLLAYLQAETYNP